MRHAKAGLDYHGDAIPRSSFYDSPFGRMFSNVTPWESEHEAAGDVRQSFVDFANLHMRDDGTDADNPNIPAGYTYFGQFVDHDITFDPTTSLMRHNDPNKHRNFRTPRLDLDSVYGAGPDASPHLYDADRFGFFLIGTGELDVEQDLPRNSAGTALVGDPRNDENIIVSQIQLAFLLLHNKVLEEIVGNDSAPATGQEFREARRLVRWTYQYVVWNDFVKRLVSPTVYDASISEFDLGLLKARRLYYKWKQAPYIPVEFSVAGYRLGHAMVRNGYQVNETTATGFDVELPIFAMDGGRDLRGGKPLPAGHSVQWDWFVELPTSASGLFPQLARPFNLRLSEGLQAIPTPDGPTPLAVLNLMRGWRLQLPSGTAVADFMGVTNGMREAGVGDCLWPYILKEASMADPIGGNGTELGSVGSRIVTEVFAGLLLGDPSSFAKLHPEWTPSTEEVLRRVLGDQLRDDWEFADVIQASGLPANGADFTAIQAALEGVVVDGTRGQRVAP